MKRIAGIAHKFLGCEEHILMSRLVRLLCISFLAIAPCMAQQLAPAAAQAESLCGEKGARDRTPLETPKKEKKQCVDA